MGNLFKNNHYIAVPFGVTRGAKMTHFSFKCIGFLWQSLRNLLLGHGPPKNKRGHWGTEWKLPASVISLFSCQKPHAWDDWFAFYSKPFYGDQSKVSFFISLAVRCNWNPIIYFFLFCMDTLGRIMRYRASIFSLLKPFLKPGPYPRRSIITSLSKNLWQGVLYNT